MKILILTLCCLATCCLAQFGPAPPRLNIPGAIPLPIQGGRALPGPVVKVRRPNRPQQAHTEARFIDEAKPVTEEADDEYAPQHQPAPPAPPRSLFTSEPQEAFQQENPSNAQRFNIERPRPAQPQRNLQQQQQQQQRPRAQNFNDEPQRPHQKPHHADDKPKKPVSQILRKYREEKPDGTIVWGFENDDGSFKEETIGIDCITHGVYGYIDPDGEKREYTYETGILCDPNKKDQEDEDVEAEDYLANLANKQQAKRPQQGQQQQQQFYRN